MNDITMNVIGNVVNEVELRFTKAGEPVASFRVASGTRRFDRNSGRWVDGDTHYFTVSCWRGLAHNVVQSLHKGMPVMVIGRLRSREVERPCKEHNHTVRYFDIEATSVGPDLARGTAEFTRTKRDSVVESERRSVADAIARDRVADDLVDIETGEILEAEVAEASAA
ncbi:MAG: single-stranded DNA-binding protein [Actinobacteria bacterium]|nr:single-stranded DNA-binding protein [Actinomycetota bacterium]